MRNLLPQKVLIAILMTGICLTLVSLFYLQPRTCNRFCLEEPCALNTCKPGQQTAGFPFPFVHDDPSQVGSSPISAWGRIDIQDFLFPDIKAFCFNVLFYSTVVLIIFVLVRLAVGAQ